MTLWAQVIGEELYSYCSMHMQFNLLSDYAESLKFITFVVFLLWVTENSKSALCGKMDNISLHAFICSLKFQGLRNADSPIHLVYL